MKTTHSKPRYTKEDKGYASVTQILSAIFPFNKEAFDKWCKANKHDPDIIMRDSQRMGTKVSEWIENSTHDMQWIDSPPTNLREEGLRRATDLFLKENDVIESETTVYCDEFDYAGTLDMLVDTGHGIAIWDAKTWGAWRWDYRRNSAKIRKVKWQTSMYAYALGPNIRNLGVVVLKTDGTYEVEQLTYTDEWLKAVEEYNKSLPSDDGAS